MGTFCESQNYTSYTIMPTDKHILVNNEYTEHPPANSGKQSRLPVETVVETEVASERNHQSSKKFFLCWEAQKGWKIFYSIKCVIYLLTMTIGAIKHEILIEKLSKKHHYDSAQEEDFRNKAWIIYWICNSVFIVFFISFGLLMYGIHGKIKIRHGFFFPMIACGWIEAVVTCLIFIFLIFENLFNLPSKYYII